jgi:hypothetical protein
LHKAWQEIAQKLRNDAFTWPLSNAFDRALLLGSCATFGGIPEEGFNTLVQDYEVPLLVLRVGEGLTWTLLSEFEEREQILEAPFELGYVLHELPGFGPLTMVAGWEGEEVLFPSEKPFSNRIPWFDAVLEFGYQTLRRKGWRPTELCLLRPPPNESLPLVSRVSRFAGSFGAFALLTCSGQA